MYVRKPNRCADVASTVGAGQNVNAGNDYFVAVRNAGGKRAQVQRRGPITHRNRVFRSNMSSKSLLESPDQGPSREPVAAEHLRDRSNVVIVDYVATVWDEGLRHSALLRPTQFFQ